MPAPPASDAGFAAWFEHVRRQVRRRATSRGRAAGDALARLIRPRRHPAHRGLARPPHPRRRLLAGAASSGIPVRLSLLHRRSGNPFTEGTRELFDLTGQGRIDLFFLGGGQIDGQANLNLVGTGAWPGREVRFPGSFGSAFMYFMARRTILFREEHSPRVLVERVANISAPGTSAPDVFRPRPCPGTGHRPLRLRLPARAGRFRLASTHPGETVEGIRAATGFSFDVPDQGARDRRADRRPSWRCCAARSATR
jgi:glutaconate CoA-transferase subunit B